MKLLACSLVALFLSSCAARKTAVSNNSSLNIEAPAVTISLLIENAYNRCSINDVLNACNNVKPCKIFSLNFMAEEKIEMKLEYTDLTSTQRVRIFEQLNDLGVTLIRASGYQCD